MYKLELDDLEVNSFPVSETEMTTFPSDVSCNAWCTLAGACASWFVCTDEPIGVNG